MALGKVAKKVETEYITQAAVVIAYVIQKTSHVFLNIGERKDEYLMANIRALSISLSPEKIEHLKGIVPFEFEPGLPRGSFHPF